MRGTQRAAAFIIRKLILIGHLATVCILVACGSGPDNFPLVNSPSPQPDQPPRIVAIYPILDRAMPWPIPETNLFELRVYALRSDGGYLRLGETDQVTWTTSDPVRYPIYPRGGILGAGAFNGRDVTLTATYEQVSGAIDMKFGPPAAYPYLVAAPNLYDFGITSNVFLSLFLDARTYSQGIADNATPMTSSNPSLMTVTQGVAASHGIGNVLLTATYSGVTGTSIVPLKVVPKS